MNKLADRRWFYPAFNGLLYGVYNLTHWFAPDRVMMGVIHLPRLVLSLVALFLSYLEPPRKEE